MRPREAVLLLLCASHAMLGIDARGHRIRLNTYATDKEFTDQNRALGTARVSGNPAVRGLTGTRSNNNVFGVVNEARGNYEPDGTKGYYSWDESSTVRYIETGRGKHKRKPKRGGKDKESSRYYYNNVVPIPEESKEETSEDEHGFLAETGPGFSTKTPSAPSPRPATGRPTNYPTAFPTPNPTPYPSPGPTPGPTPRPTFGSVVVVTRRPTPNPTDATPEPTIFPTLYPTQEPVLETPNPTIAFTYQPTQNPTVTAPLPVICRSDANGSFGSMNGKSTEVDYLYQMELFPGLTVQEATSQIEIELVNLLLPRMFPQQCSLRRRLQESKSLYIGITTKPPDSQIPGFSCVGDFVEPCFVVRGWVTVYSVSIPPDAVYSEISGYIYDILESGQIEEELMDVYKITSLRAPSMTQSPDPEKIPVANAMTAGSSTGGSQAGTSGQMPPDANIKYHDATSPHLSSTSATQNQQTSTSGITEETPFILKLPWWLWLCMLLFILILWALMAAIEKLLAIREEIALEDAAEQEQVRYYSKG